MRTIFKSATLVTIFFCCYFVIGYFATNEKAKAKEVYKPRLKPVDDDTSFLLPLPGKPENRKKAVSVMNNMFDK
jgi:hypothetical protein